MTTNDMHYIKGNPGAEFSARLRTDYSVLREVYMKEMTTLSN